MKYCPYCGADLAGTGVSFCSECGKSIAPPVRSEPGQKTRRVPQTQNKKRPVKKNLPSTRPKQEKRNGHEENRKPRRNPMDEGYDGYYDDVPTSDNGQTTERFEPELVKRIALVAGGFVAVIVLSVLVMYLL